MSIFDIKKNVENLADEIINEIVEKGNEENIEIDFHLSGGVVESDESNCVFKYNGKENSILWNFVSNVQGMESKNQLPENFGDDLKEFEYLVEEEINKKIDVVKTKVREFTPLDHEQMSKIKEDVRKKLLETIFPMEGSRVISCMLNPFFNPDSNDGFMLKIIKNSPKGTISTQSVSNDLIKRNTETGKSYDDIIKEQKKLGNSMYKYVVSAEKKYFESQCQISFYINFTPAPKEIVDKFVKENLCG